MRCCRLGSDNDNKVFFFSTKLNTNFSFIMSPLVRTYLKKLKKAMSVKDGVAYIHLFSPCPTGWRFPPEKTIEVSRFAVETNFFPLWEYERRKFRFTRSIENPKPVEEYLRRIGENSHVTQRQIEENKRVLEERCEMVKTFIRKS